MGENLSQLFNLLIKNDTSWEEFQNKLVTEQTDFLYEKKYRYHHKDYQVKIYQPKKNYLIVSLKELDGEVEQIDRKQNLFQNLPFQLWYLKNPNTYLTANRVHAEFLGYEDTDLKSKKINQLLTGKSAKKCIQANQKVFKEKREIQTTQWMENNHGEKRLLKVMRYPKLNEANEVDFVICSAEDITEEHKNREQKEMQQRILNSSMEFTKELLTNDNLEEALTAGMEMIGKATKVDRVYYWENHYNEETKEWLTSQKFEWTSAGAEPQIHKEELYNIPFREIKYFMDPLSQNKAYNKKVKNLDDQDKTRKYFELQGILSILTIPVFVEDQFKGFIGFDSSRFEKEWTELEISLLTSFVLLYEKAYERHNMKIKILQSKENFRNFFNMTQDLLIVVNDDGKIIQVNKNILTDLDYNREELIGKSVMKLYSERKQEKVKDNLENIEESKRKFVDFPILTKGGQEIPVETEVTRGMWDKEPVIYLVLKNITELKLSEDKFFKAFNNGGLSKFISKYDDGKFVEINDQFKEFIGYDRSEIMGKTTLELGMTKDYENREPFKKMIQEDGKISDLEVNFIRKDGAIRTGLTNIVPLTINNEKHLLASIIDISDRIEYEEKLLEISNKDTLTNLYNRRYLYRKVEEKIEKYKISGKTFSIVIIDIDDFKEINDQYGHLAGDYILVEFSKLLQENLEDDDVLGRFGGEEFIAIIDQKDKKRSKKILKEILEITKNTLFTYKKEEIDMTFSAGISSIKELTEKKISIDRLIGLSDKRMYLAKNTGKGKIVYREND